MMKLKRNARWALLGGFVMALVGIAMPVAVLLSDPHNGGMSIIGGMDAPTMQYLVTGIFGSLPDVLVLSGITLMISAVFCLLFSKTVKEHCAVKTSAISLGLSATGALGLVCAFVWFSIVAFDEVRKHPIEYPVSISLGLACLCVFIILIIQYFNARTNNWSVKGLVIDVLTSIFYLPTFFFIFSYLYEIIG